MSNTAKGVLLAVTTPVLWGLMSIPIRTLGKYGISGQDLAFFRCSVSGAGLFLLNLIINRRALRIDLKGLLLCILYGCFCYGASFTAYAFAVSRIPISVAMVLMFLCPVWVSILNRIVFKEQMKPVNTLSIVICLIGAVLVSNIMSVRGEKIDSLGIACALFNSLGAALQLIIPRAFEDKYPKDTFIIYGFISSAVMLGVMTSFDVVGAALASDTSRVGLNILFLTVICTLIPNYVFVKATNYIDSTLVSIISAIEVVVGSIVGYLLYKEVLSTAQTFGAVIIVIGALLPNIAILRSSVKRDGSV